MTRINLVPVTELCDQHLSGERNEIVRIPYAINDGRYNLDGQPDHYVLGKGHVKFFYDKLNFLRDRYTALHSECKRRGWDVKWGWPEVPGHDELHNDYTPTPEAIAISRQRIRDKIPANARYTQ